MITEKLKSIYGNQKSYYGKAKVNILDNGTKELISYKTKVAIITKGGNFIKLWDGYSLTTMNHINEFRMQNGLNKINKKEWLEINTKETGSKRKRIKLYNIYSDEDKIEYFEMNQLNTAIGRLGTRSKKKYINGIMMH